MRSVQICALAVLASVAPTELASARSPLNVRATFVLREQPDIAFKEKIKKAVASGKKSELESLVRGDSTQAAAWIVRFDEVLIDRDDPTERALRDGLAEGWGAAVETEFPKLFQNYLTQLDDGQRSTRMDLRKRLVRAWNDLEGNRELKDGLIFVQSADELDLLAGAFDSEGDLYSASEAYVALAQCFDEPIRGTGAEPHKAWKYWTRAAEFRKRIECKDEQLAEAEKRIEELVKKGYDKAPDPGASGGGDMPAEPEKPGESGNPITVALTFEALTAPDQFARPCYQADELYALWTPMQLGPKGSSIGFARLGDESPILHRVGASDLRFDMDFDGKTDGPTDQKIALTGTFAPFHLQVGKGDATRPWAFFGLSGIDKDNFQGIEVNLQANDDVMPVYTLSAASVTGNVSGTPIRIIDDSMDAVYGSEVLTFGYGGLTNNQFQPEMDSIVIGSAKRARPWSQYQEVGGAWWKFDSGSKGKTVNVTPVKVETGTLKLESKGVAPVYLVMHGTGDLKDSYFDLVEGGSKGVSVPVGRYTIFYGDVRKGKKRQTLKALVLPGKASSNYDVTAGKTTVVTIGAPYTFDFEVKHDEDKIKVIGGSVVVTGVGGERYERTWNCVPRPEVAWRKKGTKKASGEEKMDHITDQTELYKRGQQGWMDVWFPLDLEMETKGAESVEVQLTDDKHKLFGKVQSAWKE